MKTKTKAKKESNNDVKLLGLKLGESTVLRVMRGKYEGKTRVDIRVWYKTKTDPEFKPSGKGVSMTPEQAEKVAAAILNAAKKSK